MTIIIPKKPESVNPFIKSEQSKAKLAKSLGKSKATLPAKNAQKQKMLAAIKERKWEAWEGPDRLMFHRLLAGGSLEAGCLLYIIVDLWGLRRKKLSRDGREWLAMSRKAWANRAGLTEAEFKNNALPRVKKYCWEFLTIRAMGLGADKKLWVSLDVVGYKEALQKEADFANVMFHDGLSPLPKSPPKNAYDKGPK